MSAFQVSDDGATSVFTLYRALGERDFSSRETRLLNFFHAELGRLIGGPLVAASDPSGRHSSPLGYARPWRACSRATARNKSPRESA